MGVDQSDKLSRKIEILYEIGRELAGLRHPTELNEHVAKLAKRLVDYRALVLFVTEPDQRLTPEVVIGVKRGFSARPALSLNTPLVKYLARSGKPLVLQASVRGQQLMKGILQVREDIRSEVLLPLFFEGSMLGILAIGFAERSPLTDESVLLLKTLGNTVAGAFANIRLRQREAVLRDENLALRREIGHRYRFDQLVGNSPRMRRVFELTEKVVPSTTTVLIEGETGTGKELVARAIHYGGPRKERRFLAQNCAALPETLLESELFGHKKGAFTGATQDKKGLFEMANGGTVFLDEIGDTPAAMQAKLLRVLQDGEIRPIGSDETRKVDVRIIAATNRDLEREVREGRFRKDLYFRLKVFPIRLPPLRERIEDIPELARHFAARFSKDFAKEIRGITPEALVLLQAYPYPGNVRELENEMERAVTLADAGSWLTPSQLSDAIREAAGRSRLTGERPLRGRLHALERELIETALAESGGNVSATARALGISRQWLMVRMKKYGLARV
jgi:transcriptional regulator with GAF, ATPase, and Fis domain